MTDPLFTMRECATYLQTPLGTLQAWACPKDVGPLVTVFPSPGRQASVPFVGSAEAFVLGPLRKAGVQTQRIRLAVKKLNDELGLDHPRLAAGVHRRRRTDLRLRLQRDDAELLTVVRTGQEPRRRDPRYLKRSTDADDG